MTKTAIFGMAWRCAIRAATLGATALLLKAGVISLDKHWDKVTAAAASLSQCWVTLGRLGDLVTPATAGILWASVIVWAFCMACKLGVFDKPFAQEALGWSVIVVAIAAAATGLLASLSPEKYSILLFWPAVLMTAACCYVVVGCSVLLYQAFSKNKPVPTQA